MPYLIWLNQIVNTIVFIHDIFYVFVWNILLYNINGITKCSISIYISISYSQNLDARNLAKLTTVYVIKKMFDITQDMNKWNDKHLCHY